MLICIIISLYGCFSQEDKKKSVSEDSNTFDLRKAQVIPSGYEYPNQNTFKVMSWNVEHFVDEYDDPFINADREDKPDSSMEEKVSYLVEALKKENSDIVLLQEFESTKFLKQIAKDHLKGMGYKFFASAPSDNWYMNVVIMSKLPLGVLYSYGSATTPVIDYKNEDGLIETQNKINTRMWSLEVFPAKDYNFILTGLHLKAGRGERNESMRLGQIQLLKQQFERFITLNSSQNLLVAGDLNSTLGSKEIKALKQGENKANTFYDPLPEDVLTHSVENPSRRLDYALFNGNMQNEYVKGSAQIPDLLSTTKMEKISDHFPVVITFKNMEDLKAK